MQAIVSRLTAEKSRLMGELQLGESADLLQAVSACEGVFSVRDHALLRFGTEEQRSQLIDTLTARWQSFIPADSRCPIRAVKVGLVRIDGELKFANDFKKDQTTDTATILVDGSFYPLASNPSALLACAMGLHEISLQLAERGSKPSFDEVPHLTLTRFAESLGFALKGRDGNLGSILARGGAIKPTGEGLELEPDFSDTTPFLGIDRKRFPGYALVELA